MINADKKLIYADLTYRIRGAIFAVYNELGFGHKEQVYQKALIEEFKYNAIPFKREVGLKVLYKDVVIGNYRPDFIIDEKIIIELKAVEFVPKSFEIQLLQYLKATGFALGLLINFGSPKLYIKRLVNTYPHKLNQLESVLHPRKSIPVINLRESVVPQSGTERR